MGNQNIQRCYVIVCYKYLLLFIFVLMKSLFVCLLDMNQLNMQEKQTTAGLLEIKQKLPFAIQRTMVVLHLFVFQCEGEVAFFSSKHCNGRIRHRCRNWGHWRHMPPPKILQ